MDVGLAADTPAFLLWSIEFGCPIRSFEDGTIPERVERQLRAARTFSQARREGRVFEGLALAPPDGFRIEEALAIYGGQSAVEANCRGCPVNALSGSDLAALAGCYGWVPLPIDPTSVYATVETAIDSLYGAESWATLFPVTRPRWFGLWLSPLWAEHLLVAARVLEAAAVADRECRQALDELLLGLRTAYHADRSLHVRAYSGGRVEDNTWRLVMHCPQCSAPWPEKAARQCGVCDYAGAPAPDKKRLPRGQRPYFPLERLLGREQAAALLVRYAASREQPESPDPPRSPLPPAPSGNPPGG